MGRLVIKEMLKYNFYLSKWFAGRKRDKVVSGTSFLFLNQVSFLFLDIFLIVLKLLPIEFSPMISSIFVMSVVIFIMFGLQKRVQKSIHKKDFEKNYNLHSKKDIYVKRTIGFILFVLPFVFSFIIAAVIW